MTAMYTCEHFVIQELVPPAVYQARGEAAWQLLDRRMLLTIDEMRRMFGPMVINTWHSDTLQAAYGLRQYSGLRTVGFYFDVYGDDRGLDKFLDSFSQHKYGRAFDALFRNISADEVRAEVRKRRERFPYLTAIETGISWFHGDVRNCKPLMEFEP